MSTESTLRQQLRRLDQSNYGAYKDIQGQYEFPHMTLIIDRVQGDPFAAPSQLRVCIPQKHAGFPPDLYRSPSRAIALRDYLTRSFARTAESFYTKRGSGKSGMIAIAPTSQAMLDRTAAGIDEQSVEVRFVVGLPAFGRRIAGLQAIELLCEDLPEICDRALLYRSLKPNVMQRHVETAEDADAIRQQLFDRHLVAFIANGAILPRRSGVDEKPLREGAIAFHSPESLQVEFTCPNRGKVVGMGISEGVTLIVGGGYHGKSTLLNAIEVGVYNHIPKDGREFVVTRSDAVKIRAEDGRSVVNVNISPFINHLPFDKSTTQFSTPNASGSTSQAASIMEALEVGSRVLLVDEDTSATNFMIRDRRMQALVAKEHEPITPFIDKIRQLYIEYQVSTILVMGGSGDYFDVADTVILMQDFQPQDVTEPAQKIAQQFPTDRRAEGGQSFGAMGDRHLKVMTDESSDRPPKRKVRDLDTIVLGNEEIDLFAVEQLIETNQLRAIAAILQQAQHFFDGRRSLAEIVQKVMQDLDSDGFDRLTNSVSGEFAQFRRFELAAAINRWRSLQ